MSTKNVVELSILRFSGERFAKHSMDVDCTRELITYRNIVLECAKELWRRKNPDRVRLPQKFEDGFRLEFDEVRDGSATIPLRRVRPSDQGTLDWGNLDEFDEAAQLIDAAIAAANEDKLLPETLPSNVIPLFKEFGKTLTDDEILFTKARHAPNESSYTAVARKRLSEWVVPTYEDIVDLIGEVRMANVGAGNFSLVDQTGTSISGKFTLEQEENVLEALKNHRNIRLRIRGTGEFETHSRQLKRILRIEGTPEPVVTAQYDETAPSIWDQLSSLGVSAPIGTWDAVPVDLSTRIDDLVYRRESDLQ